MQIPRARNQFVYKEEQSGTEVWIKRLDELHPDALGNKLFKLRYNLIKAKKTGYTRLLTFGGAYSNHIAATAIAGREAGMETIGVIRGEELGADLRRTFSQNPTLKKAAENGMKFHFVSRSDYRLKNTDLFIAGLREHFGEVYILPEGGTNPEAVKGCEEILTPEDETFDMIACAVGTGGTISGLINASAPHQKVVGFAVVKADLTREIKKYTHRQNWTLDEDDYFGGFAKINLELVGFINNFAKEYGIPLDPLYTGKMMFKLTQKIKRGDFRENRRILAVHTGGLQGVVGMNQKLLKNGLPLIDI